MDSTPVERGSVRGVRRGELPGQKKMLNKLKACGLIRVHTNNYAYIAFLERADWTAQRADSGIPRADQRKRTLMSRMSRAKLTPAAPKWIAVAPFWVHRVLI